MPTPITLDAGCALVVLEPGGRVRLAVRPPVALSIGAQVAPGEGVVIQSGHVELVRGTRVVWRSQRKFPHRPGTFTRVSAAALAGRRLVYEVSRWWGRPRVEHPLVFVTDGTGDEHLLPTRASPLGWTARGLVTAQGSRTNVVLRVWRADGRPAAAPRTLTTSAWVWDWTSHRLVAVSRGRVVQSDGSSLTPLARLGRLGIVRGPSLTVSPLGDGLVEIATMSGFAVLDRSGRTVARATVPTGWRLDGALAATRTGTVAYETTPISHAAARRFRLYAATSGRRPSLIDRYVVPPTCVYHDLSVRGTSVLLSSQGIARAYDLRGSHAPVDLLPAVRWLLGHHRTGEPSFA
jgi:hypothetical protein